MIPVSPFAALNSKYLDKSTGLHFTLQIIMGILLTQEEPRPLFPNVPGILCLLTTATEKG